MILTKSSRCKKIYYLSFLMNENDVLDNINILLLLIYILDSLMQYNYINLSVVTRILLINSIFIIILKNI